MTVVTISGTHKGHPYQEGVRPDPVTTRAAGLG